MADPPDLTKRHSSMYDDEDGAKSLEYENVDRNGRRERKKEFSKIEYTMADTAPYRIFFEMKIQEEESRINKFIVGSTLRKMEQFKKHIIEMKQNGRHRVVVYLNNFVKANHLMEEINTNDDSIFTAYVPQHLVCVTGVIAGVPTEIDIEEIQADLESDVPIVKVQRLTRFIDKKKVPANRISVTFRSNILPDRVRLFACSTRVRPFLQNLVVCGNCFRFNHRTDNCRGKRRCERCSIQHEKPEDFETCNRPIKCAHCKSADHTTQQEECPEKQRQKNIKALMAKRTITFAEASEQYPIWTQNPYAPLENQDEFPTINSSFARMTSNQHSFVDPLREQWRLTNLEREKITPAVKVYPEKSKFKTIGSKRPRTDIPTNAGKITEERNKLIKEVGYGRQYAGTPTNPVSVGENEKWEQLVNAATKKAETTASQQTQETVMSFYTEFLQQLGNEEAIKRKFKSCTQKYFKLANSIHDN